MTQGRKRPSDPADKAPAYQWYPKDARTDQAFMLMTWDERGIYRELLDHQWLHGGIPNNPVMIAQLVNSMGCGWIEPDRFVTDVWPKLRGCFGHKVGDMVANGRLERQRKELHKFIRNQSDKGFKGAAKRWGNKWKSADGRGMSRPKPNDGSASATATAPAVQEKRVPAVDLFADGVGPDQIDALIALWNAERRPGPKVHIVMPHGKRRTIAKALKVAANLDDWRTVIAWINTQPWMNGQGSGDLATWRADFGFLIKPGKLHEYLERARTDAQRIGTSGRDVAKGRTGFDRDKYSHLKMAKN